MAKKPPAGPFTIGDLIRCAAAFTNSTGVAADPATLTFEWSFIDQYGRKHGPTTWTYGVDAQIVHESTGAFHADLDTLAVALGGTFYRRWYGYGPLIKAADERELLVDPSIVLPG